MVELLCMYDIRSCNGVWHFTIALRRCFLECVVVMFWIAAAFHMLLVRIVDLACNRDNGNGMLKHAAFVMFVFATAVLLCACVCDSLLCHG